MMVRTQISLSPEQHAAVHELAEARGESMSAVIRDAVDRLVALSQKSAWQVLAEVAGSGRDADGATDVAVNHDDYVYGPWHDEASDA